MQLLTQRVQLAQLLLNIKVFLKYQADPNKVGLFFYNYLFAVKEKSLSSTTWALGASLSSTRFSLSSR